MNNIEYIALAIALVVLPYAVVVRPWHLRWGATDSEIRESLPGDSLLPSVPVQVTRAVLIDAPAADVWPWLVQMGQGRAAFYSYTWVENLIGCRMKNADRIVPEWQHLQLGDAVRLHPSYTMYVHVLEPNRALVLASFPESSLPETEDSTSDGLVYTWTWAFILDQQSERHSRLIVRIRGTPKRGLATSLWNLLILEPGDFIMERKMLLGIRQRVERQTRDP